MEEQWRRECQRERKREKMEKREENMVNKWFEWR